MTRYVPTYLERDGVTLRFESDRQVLRAALAAPSGEALTTRAFAARLEERGLVAVHIDRTANGYPAIAVSLTPKGLEVALRDRLATAK